MSGLGRLREPLFLLVAHWAEVAKCRLVAGRIVEAVDVLGYRVVRFSSRCKGFVADALLLDACKERFRHRVVVTVASAAHARDGLPVRKQLTVPM